MQTWYITSPDGSISSIEADDFVPIGGVATFYRDQCVVLAVAPGGWTYVHQKEAGERALVLVENVPAHDPATALAILDQLAKSGPEWRKVRKKE